MCCSTAAEGRKGGVDVAVRLIADCHFYSLVLTRKPSDAADLGGRFLIRLSGGSAITAIHHRSVRVQPYGPFPAAARIVVKVAKLKLPHGLIV
jgi:hypothetical protein